MISLERYKEAFACLPEGAAEAEVNAETHRILSVDIRDGEMCGVEVSESTELFVRVSGERTGYAYTQDVNEDPREIIRTAFANSRFSERPQPERMIREARKEVYAGGEAKSDVNELAQAGIRMERELRSRLEALAEGGPGGGFDARKLEVSVSVKSETYGQHTVNSHGLDAAAESPVCVLRVSVSAGKESVGTDLVRGDIGDFDPEEIAGPLAWRLGALEREAADFVSGSQEVILSEAAVSQMFMTAWQEFSAVKYADGACALAGLLGEKIAPRALTITDCPLPEKEGGYPAFCDAEGTEGVPVRLVDKGVFAGLMTNQTTAGRLKLPATGNAGRRPLLFGNIATDILVTPKNFCIEPGEFTLAEMEEHMGDGILITEYFDLFHSLDIASGNFSVPCYGIVIMGGKECGCVRGLTLSGNIRDLLGGVTEVGNHRVIHPMEFLENYGIGSCAMRTGRLSVSGE